MMPSLPSNIKSTSSRLVSVERIIVSNFKSFNELDVRLGAFNVLIGANASGKSNFVNIFRFLKDAYTYGIDNAVSMQGGIEFLRNINSEAGQSISIEVFFGYPQLRTLLGQIKGEIAGLVTSEAVYRLVIKCGKSRQRFSVLEEQLSQKGEFVLLKGFPRKTMEEKPLGRGELISAIVAGKPRTDIKLEEGQKLDSEDKGSSLFLRERVPSKSLILRDPFFSNALGGLCSIYDFDPKLPKKATPITGKAELEEDGSNLAIVLQRIVRNKEKRRQFSNLVASLLPFIDAVDIEKTADRSLIFKLKERYFRRRYLPASSLSDGTIHIAALIVALYFGAARLTMIEEPERNIHPHLISQLVNMMKDAARSKQLLVTTQNPEVVKHAGLDNLLCVSRSSNGFSNITRLSEQSEVKTFLEHEVGIETLYVQDIIGSTK
jgi:predicted ATPase